MATNPVTSNAVIPVVTGETTPVKGATAQEVIAKEKGITSIKGEDGKAAKQALPLTPFGSGMVEGQGVALNGTQQTQVTAIAQSISSGASTESIQSKWADFVSGMNAGPSGGCIDVNALVQEVLRQSYMEQTQDLEFYAQKVQFYNTLKQQIRGELTKARNEDSASVGLSGSDSDLNTCNLAGGSYQGINYANEPDTTTNPPSPKVLGNPSMTNRAQLENYISNLEDQLNSVGDDAQLANVDLQDTLQKQQATLQMVSNISKMLYDTATAVIRKIGS